MDLSERITLRIAIGISRTLSKLSGKNRLVDPMKFGLVPNDQVSAEPVVDAAFVEVRTAVESGDWEPAAAMLADAPAGDGRRDQALLRLAKLALADDAWLTAWLDARPGDADPVMVKAEFLVHLAWEIRTGNLAENVSREQFAAFHRVLGDAERTAQEAAALAPDDPTPWGTAITIGRGLQYPNPQFEALWSELIARDPLHRRGHESALQYWCKKWFGSHERMFSFAQHAAAKSPSLSVLPLLATYEFAAKEATLDGYRSEQTQADTDAVLAWLAGDGANHPQVHNDRSILAYVLTLAGRGSEAVEQFRALGTRADGYPWGYFQNPAAKFIIFRDTACRSARNASRPATFGS